MTKCTQARETHTIKEVKLLQQGHTQIKHLTLIQTQQQQQTRYEIHFTLITQHQTTHSTLITTRNKPYVLANLTRGVQFLLRLFLELETIDVKLIKNKKSRPLKIV